MPTPSAWINLSVRPEMRIVAFYFKQIVLLGTAGFLSWLCTGWWHMGWFWANETHHAWLIALALTCFFLVLVCTPIQSAMSRLRSDWLAHLGGLLAVPLAVFVYLAFNTRFAFTWHDHVVHQVWMHLIFGLLGLFFSIAYRRRFGPNHSFNPTPSPGTDSLRS